MIRILPRYVFRELLAAFVLCLLLIVSVMLAGFALQWVYQGLDPIHLGPGIPYFAFFALPYAIPAALLTAAVMVFGRLSAENEITAIRSSGIHLHVVVVPALLSGLVATMLTMHLTCNVMPSTYFKIDRLKRRAAKDVATQILKTRGEITVRPYQIKAREVDGDVYKDVTIIEYDDDYVSQVWSGREAVIINDPETQTMALELRQCVTLKTPYRDPTQIQTGEFEKVSFSVKDSSLGQKVPTKFKHMDMRMLLKQRIDSRKYVAGSGDRFADPKETKEEAYKKMGEIDVVRNAILAKEREAAREAKLLTGEIAAARSKIDTAQQTFSKAEQQITAAEAAIAKVDRELKALEGKDTPEAEQQRQERLKARATHLGDKAKGESARGAARSGVAEANTKITELTDRIRKLEDQRKTFLQDLKATVSKRHDVERIHKAADAQLSLRDVANEAHTRIAMAFSCLTFMLVGVPLGLIVKRGNFLIGFGVGFFVILLVYYPLVLGGQVLIEDKYWPIPPLVWAPNAVLALFGIGLLGRLFRR